MNGPKDLRGALALLTEPQRRLVALAPHAFAMSTDAELAADLREAEAKARAAWGAADAAETAGDQGALLASVRNGLLAAFAQMAIATEAARRAGLDTNAAPAMTRAKMH